ncbi:MAG: hypothetical protein IPH23_12410 [Gammaproteobacteria bacterium]|nr:hypothetical protein [Gammaproteobacteria bacterium]
MQHGKHLAEQAARDLATSSKNSATAVGPAERPLPDPALIDAINQAFALFRVNYWQPARQRLCRHHAARPKPSACGLTACVTVGSRAGASPPPVRWIEQEEYSVYPGQRCSAPERTSWR